MVAGIVTKLHPPSWKEDITWEMWDTLDHKMLYWSDSLPAEAAVATSIPRAKPEILEPEVPSEEVASPFSMVRTFQQMIETFVGTRSHTRPNNASKSHRFWFSRTIAGRQSQQCGIHDNLSYIHKIAGILAEARWPKPIPFFRYGDIEASSS